MQNEVPRRRAGRPKGVPNRKTRQQIELAEATGETPLQYMLRIMRDETIDPARRDDMAKAAAPYLHARLASIDTRVSGDPERPVHQRIEWAIVRPAD